MKKINLLVVEDEEAIRDMLRFSLEKANFFVFDAESTEQAMLKLNNLIPDVIILDWMLPGKSGIEFIRWIRNEKCLRSIPIIMLTAKAEEENKIKGLLVGADDYIIKPFSTNELIARIKTVLRRGVLISPDNEIKMDNIILNSEKYTVTVKDQNLKLMLLEYKLLYFFMTHPNKTYTRDQLITNVYGRTTYINERTIDVQIKRLRGKLRPHGYDKFIQTVRGVGYCFVGK